MSTLMSFAKTMTVMLPSRGDSLCSFTFFPPLQSKLIRIKTWSNHLYGIKHAGVNISSLFCATVTRLTWKTRVLFVTCFCLFYTFRKFMFCTFRKFQLYNAIQNISTESTMLYFRSSGLIHILTESFHPFTKPLLFFPAPSPYQSFLYFLRAWFCFIWIYTQKWNGWTLWLFNFEFLELPPYCFHCDCAQGFQQSTGFPFTHNFTNISSFLLFDNQHPDKCEVT